MIVKFEEREERYERVGDWSEKETSTIGIKYSRANYICDIIVSPKPQFTIDWAPSVSAYPGTIASNVRTLSAFHNTLCSR